MQNVLISERDRLMDDVEHLSEALATYSRPLGLKQRAKCAFLKQLHAYKCQRLEDLSDGLGNFHPDDAEAKRVGRI